MTIETLKKLTNIKVKKRKFHPYAKINWNKAAELFQRLNVPHKQKDYPSVKFLLQILAKAGAIGIVFAFPGAAKELVPFILGDKNYSRWQTKKVITKLAKQKYVLVIENADDTVTVKITKNGMARALTYRLNSISLEKPKKWDGKWRLVLFDIPEKYRKLRDIFRMRLRQMDLYPLQESAFVSPYKCFNEIEFLRELYGIAFSVKYLLVEEIEEDTYLRDYFKLA